MSNIVQNEIKSDQKDTPLDNTPSHRRRPLRVVFIHSDAQAVDRCVEELEKAHFTVSADVVLALAQCTEQLRSQSYDVVLAEYPSTSWNGSQALQLLEQTVQEIPLLFLATALESESVAEVAAHDFHYVEREDITQLPMAVRRALNEKELSSELAEAEKALRHSKSLYRALVDNPAYGVFRCDAKGKILDVNLALLTMLDYPTKEELVAGNHWTPIFLDLCPGIPLGGHDPETIRIEPVEIEWARKNATTLKAMLSGRGVRDDDGDFAGCEMIAVDITEHRALEEQLRSQALSDPLTGLANSRRLVEVLNAEIGRSKRTEREFSLLLLDLDGLKEINDRFGHLAGNRALGRVAQVLADSCRSIDTAARQGGDEFALVLPEANAATAELIAQRICDLLAKDADGPPLSVSLGIATYPKDAGSIGALLHAADKALYTMKHKRRSAARAGNYAQSTVRPEEEG